MSQSRFTSWSRWIFPAFTAFGIAFAVSTIATVWSPTSPRDFSFTNLTEFMQMLRTEFANPYVRVRWILFGGPLCSAVSLAVALTVWFLVGERRRRRVEKLAVIALLIVGIVVWVLANHFMGLIGFFAALCGVTGAAISLRQNARDNTAAPVVQ